MTIQTVQYLTLNFSAKNYDIRFDNNVYSESRYIYRYFWTTIRTNYHRYCENLKIRSLVTSVEILDNIALERLDEPVHSGMPAFHPWFFIPE